MERGWSVFWCILHTSVHMFHVKQKIPRVLGAMCKRQLPEGNSTEVTLSSPLLSLGTYNIDKFMPKLK